MSTVVDDDRDRCSLMRNKREKRQQARDKKEEEEEKENKHYDSRCG